MRNSIKTILGAAGLVLAVSAATGVSLATRPAEASAYSLLGHSLGLTNNDYRVHNNFADPTANNNTAPHIDYPGATGAVMAIWKAVAEWGSDLHGTGTGDVGHLIGSGGSNFDANYQGTTTSFANYVEMFRVLPEDGGSVYAFHQRSGSHWRIRFYEIPWDWADGPGSIPGSQTDIQGIACHEYGHALGLGHSTAGGSPTMTSGCFVCTAERSIASDDIAGIQAIYGVKQSLKPRIDSLGGSTEIGQTLTIAGANFSVAPTNEVWFTKANSDGAAVKVTGVNSDGQNISVTVPAGIQDGDVHVRRNQSGIQSLSQAYPFDVDDGSPQAPVVSSVSPDSGPNAGWTVVDIEGINFATATAVKFGANDAQNFNIVHAGLIEATTPPGTLGQTVDVSVVNPDGTGILAGAFTYGTNPFIDIDSIDPSSGPESGGQTVTISGPNVVPVFWINFDGIGATNIQVQSQTELTCVTPPHAPGFVDVFEQGSGTDTLFSAYEYVESGDFIDIGPGLGGSFGVPSLTGSGDLRVGGLGATISVASVAPSAGGVWFVSLAQVALPLEGGTLYTFPFLLQIPIVVSAGGTLDLPITVPPAATGLTVYNQMWFSDATGPFGYTASNGLALVFP